MLAAIGFDEVHVVWPVTFRVVPFESTSVAVYCTAVPTGVVLAMGERDSELAVALVTTRIACPAIGPSVAVTMVLPAARASTWPAAPATLLIVATIASSVVHVTCAVTSALLPSEYTPVAV